MHSLTGNLSQNSPVQITIYRNSFKQSLSNYISQHFQAFHDVLVDQSLIPLKSICQLFAVALLKDTDLRREYLLQRQMHILSQKTTRIINSFITELDFNLFPQVYFVQLMFRRH